MDVAIQHSLSPRRCEPCNAVPTCAEPVPLVDGVRQSVQAHEGVVVHLHYVLRIVLFCRRAEECQRLFVEGRIRLLRSSERSNDEMRMRSLPRASFLLAVLQLTQGCSLRGCICMHVQVRAGGYTGLCTIRD